MTHRTIGILGGMSWHSTAAYYGLVNELVAERLGGLHSARVLLASVDFAPYEALQRAGDWTRIGELLADEAVRLQSGGAQLLVLATNTMHLVADAIVAAIDIPFLHVADAIAVEARALGATRVGVLGTRFTMRESFLVDALRTAGVVATAPAPELQGELDRIIFEELVRGELRDGSRRTYLGAIEALREDGCDAVALACTEIGLLVGEADEPALPLIDTTVAHARLAVELALA